MCKDCIHEKVCLHKANTQNDTYAYMGVKYDTKKCEFFKNTADVAEVKHGEWKTDRFGFERSICSVCGAVFEGDGGNYCRKCGAKMDGERK